MKSEEFILENSVLERKEEIIELIKKQPKAKIDWVATILQLDVEELREHAEDIGLELRDDHLSLPVKEVKEKVVAEPSIAATRTATMTQAPYRSNSSGLNITKKQVFSGVGIVCSLSISGVSIWMIIISLMILISYWKSAYAGFFNSAFAAEYYMLFFGFLMLLGSIVSIIFFVVRIQR